MISLSVRDICKVDSISNDNHRAWDRIVEYLENNHAGEEVELDFSDIVMNNINTAIPSFCTLLRNEKIHFKFFNNENVANSVVASCILCCNKDGSEVANRVINIEPVIKQEKKVNKDILNRYTELFNPNGEVVNIQLGKLITQVQSDSTINNLYDAITEWNKDKGDTRFIIDCTGVAVLSALIPYMSTKIDQLDNAGISVDIKSDDKDTMEMYNLYRCAKDKLRLSRDERLAKVVNELKTGTPGLLIEYKTSKNGSNKDIFGRYGNGVVRSCRPAIFNGIVEKRTSGSKHIAEKVTREVTFTSYNCNTFWTKEHHQLEFDGARLKKLVTENISVDIDKVGFFDWFFGTHYHFAVPIQEDKSENVTLVSIRNDGSVESKLVTVPERMKAVFDDWGIGYNKEFLEECIENTREKIK